MMIKKIELDVPSKCLLIMDICYLNNQKVMNELKTAYKEMKKNDFYSFINEESNINLIRTNKTKVSVLLNSKEDLIESVEILINEEKHNPLKVKEKKSYTNVDSATMVIYDAETILSEWKNESDENIDYRISLVTTSINKNLLNIIEEKYNISPVSYKNVKHIIDRNHVVSIENIRYLFSLKKEGLNDFKKIIKDNSTSKFLNNYNEHIEITPKTSSYYLNQVNNFHTKINENTLIQGLKFNTGYGDGYYPVKQYITENDLLLKMVVEF